ncbi:MAG: 50S ribosomal protein L23 [Phycisphaerae bacterium]|nr:50S ribosomal protein L23 [Phycisphaerae bacterium]
MDLYHTIIRPVVTEKSARMARRQSDKFGGIYTFQVRPDANKAEVRDAVEKIYGVKVLSVRTSIRMGKARRFRQFVGQASPVKQAVVTVDPNSHIDLF